MSSYIIKPATPNGVSFATSQRNSASNSQLRFGVHDLIDKYVMKLPSSWRTLETVCQKFCETHCKIMFLREMIFWVPNCARSMK